MTLPRLRSLGQALQQAPVRPGSVIALLETGAAAAQFRRLVRDLFPEAEDEIWRARAQGQSLEEARVGAFLHRVAEQFFPVYDLEEYEQVLAGIPFLHEGWSYESFHDLDRRPGELLLLVLCQQPLVPGLHSRVALLDAAAAFAPQPVLVQIPAEGLTPGVLHERLDGTEWAAAAAFADWLWGETGTAFLDLDEETVTDAGWSADDVRELAEEWQRASGLLDRITDLETWLEADLSERFARLLEAALGRDAHLEYLRMRRFYACEISQEGLVVLPHDEFPESLSPGAAR